MAALEDGYGETVLSAARVRGLIEQIDALAIPRSRAGARHVLPGSQELGVLTDEQVHEQSQSLESRECCAPAGSIVAMRPLIIHASSKCKTADPRRVLHIEYAPSLQIAPGMRLRAA